MRLRAGLIAALMLWCGGGGARADWEVHRSTSAAVDQLARVFSAHPERQDLALRLVRGRTLSEVERLLRRFETSARERPADYGTQLAYAQLLLATRRWDAAAAHFEAATHLAPLEVAPRWGGGRALRSAGKLAEAVLELRAALALARDGQQVKRLASELIAAAVAAGDVNAEIEGRRADITIRQGERAVFALAGTLNSAGRPAEAARELAERARAFARTPEQRARWAVAEGRYRAAAGELEAAAAALARAIREVPRQRVALREEIWAVVVEVARRRGTLDDVKRLLSDPVDVAEWVARARVSDEQGDLRGAWAALREAVRRSPRDLDLRQREIAVARRVGSQTEVVALYEKLAQFALVVAPDDPTVIVGALDGLWDLGRPDSAGHLVDIVLARGQVNSQAMLRALGEAAGRWGDDRRAERCWETLLRRAPHDEVAAVALGEIRLQRGQRRAALDTWRAVVGARAPGTTAADRHGRLAEILMDHDFPEQALAEARLAVSVGAGEPRAHRVLAIILEKQARLAAAETEWETVLKLARGREQLAARNEARLRLVGLWTRAGGGRLEAKLHAMEEAVLRDGGDGEGLIFLVQAQLRAGRADAALGLMEKTLACNRGTPPVKGALTENGEGTADLILLLARTLRQLHRTDEAMRWLEQLSRQFPARAPEARLQLAEMALGEHADERARAYAEEAATSAMGDSRALLRAAAVEERLGHDDRAAAMYRRLLASENRDPAAALALASLLAKTADIEEQRALLREVLRRSDDEEVVSAAGSRAVVLEEASGTLEGLEAFVADTADLNGGSAVAAARRRLLAAVLWRLVPHLYRNQRQDVAARAKLKQYARHGVRALLELADAPDAASDTRAVQLLGMLGAVEAVPGLARLLVPGAGDASAVQPGPPKSPAGGGAMKDELAAVTVIALGRLGGELARVALESFAPQSTPALRLPLLWALGRVGGGVAAQRARQELERNGTDAAIVGCLTLGRAGGAGEGDARLLAVAEDPLRPALVRVAAVLGLGLGGRRPAAPALRRLSATADPLLAVAARTSLHMLGRPNGWPDEAIAIVGVRIDGEALLDALQGSTPASLSWPPERETAPVGFEDSGPTGPAAP